MEFYWHFCYAISVHLRYVCYVLATTETDSGSSVYCCQYRNTHNITVGEGGRLRCLQVTSIRQTTLFHVSVQVLLAPPGCMVYGSIVMAFVTMGITALNNEKH